MAEESVYENLPSKYKLNSDQVKDILLKMHHRITKDQRIHDLTTEIGLNQVELFRTIFPIIVDIQIQLLDNMKVGLEGREGLKEFLYMANQYSKQDTEVNQLFTAIRQLYLPGVDS